jgi:phosphoglycerate dehydrogenase-like enzyme
MKVTFTNSSSSEEELDKMLRNSDVLCISLPLNANTHRFLDMRRLSLLKKRCMLVNVGRDGTVDQEALATLLQSGHIAGAGLDVFESEPHDSKAPDEVAALVNLKNVVATPHIGYNTAETMERLGGPSNFEFEPYLI